MVGQFDRKFFIDFLRDIDEAEMSGILRLRQNRSLKALFFEGGNLVFGISNLPDEEIGQHLVNIRRIRPDQLNALQTMINRAQPLTRLLMQYNLLSHDELAHIEHEVVAGMALSCFHWDGGEYTFDDSKTADHEFKTQIRALDILAEGIRRIRDDDDIRTSIGDLSQLVRPVKDIQARTRRVTLNPLEGFVVSQIDRVKNIKTLIAGCGRPEMEVLRSLYVMLATGVLDPLEEGVEPPAPPRTGTAPLRAQAVPAPTASLPRASGAWTKLSPLDQTFSTLQTAQRQEVEKRMDEAMRNKNSKINTAKLEALAGIKIRSSAGPPQQQSEGDARAEQWFVQGKQSLRMGDMRKAEALFRQCSEALPDKAKYLLALAMLLMKRPTGRKEAEGLLLKCCELEPQAIEPRIQLAGIYEQQGLAAKAEMLYKSVINIDPDHPVASQKVKKEDNSLWSKILKK